MWIYSILKFDASSMCQMVRSNASHQNETVKLKRQVLSELKKKLMARFTVIDHVHMILFLLD